MNKIPDNKVGHSYSFEVKKSHLDQLNHVNNIVYLRWVQEASEKHWEALTDESLRKANLWMALRHEIDYLNQAFLGDEITMYTWIEKSSGVKSVRMVHIYKGDMILTKCKTIWVLLDPVRFKPKRIPAELLQIFGNQ